MGFRRKTVSLMGGKIAAETRLPACFFRFGRLRMLASGGWSVSSIRRRGNHSLAVIATRSGGRADGRGRRISLTGVSRPYAAHQRGGRAGVGRWRYRLIRREIYTGRDNVHAYLMKNLRRVDLRGAVIYHCGPVMLKQGDSGSQGRRTDHIEPRRTIRTSRHSRIRPPRVIARAAWGSNTAALKECGAVYCTRIAAPAESTPARSTVVLAFT